MAIDVTLKRVNNSSGTSDELYPTTRWAQVNEKPSTYTPTAHTHGDINSVGRITSASVPATAGDYLLISDTSASGAIKRGIALAYSTTSFLRNDGAWAIPTISRYDNAKNTDIKFNTASSYTLVVADAGTTIFTQASSPTIITVPTNLSAKIPIGSEINIIRYNSQEVTISYASGVIIYSEGNSAANAGKRRINAEYQMVTLKKTSTDAWILYGSLKS